MITHKDFVKTLIEYTKVPNNRMTFELVVDITKQVNPNDYQGFYIRVIKKDKYGDALKAIVEVAEEYKERGQLCEEAQLWITIMQSKGIVIEQIIQELAKGNLLPQGVTQERLLQRLRAAEEATNTMTVFK